MKKILLLTVILSSYALSGFTSGTTSQTVPTEPIDPQSDGRPYLPRIDNQNKDSEKVYRYTQGSQNINVKLTDPGI